MWVLQELLISWVYNNQRWCRKFKEISEQDLFPNTVSGFTFDTVTIDVPKYLNYLLTRFLEKGGTLIRGSVQHIDQVLEAGSAPFKDDASTEGSAGPDAVVVCVGLGARFLGGVEDKTVYPSRGQTVILHAPWVRSGCTFEGPGVWTYIIPRRSGNVVVGGTLGVDDWKVFSGIRFCWENFDCCSAGIPNPVQKRLSISSNVDWLSVQNLHHQMCEHRGHRRLKISYQS